MSILPAQKIVQKIAQKISKSDCHAIELRPWLPVHVHDDVVGVDGGGHVLAGVAVRRVRDDEGGLADGAVAEEHALDLVLKM